MRLVLVIVSTLLALVNALCFHGVWRSQRYLDDVWESEVPLDDVRDSTVHLDDVRDSTVHLDDVWGYRKYLDDDWDTWHSRKHLDDVSHEHCDGTWNSLEHDSDEYSSHSSRGRMLGSIQRCFVSVLRPKQTRERNRRRLGIYYAYLIHEAKTYHDAREYCEERDGNLFKIDGNKDNKKIIRLLRSTCGHDGDYWIGLNKLDEDGRGGRGYYWDLDHKFPTHTYWWRGADRSYDCVAMVQEGNFQWSDRNCNQKMYFICESDHRQ